MGLGGHLDPTANPKLKPNPNPDWVWEDFVLIPGCVVGRHSNVKPKAIEPEPMNNAPIQVSAAEDTCKPCETPEEDKPEPEDDMIEVPDVAEDGSTTCGNHGCRKKFNVNDVNEEPCHYHPNPPLFHDGKKGYTCCNVHVYDFDDFMKIPTCAVGKCVPKTKMVKKSPTSTMEPLLDLE